MTSSTGVMSMDRQPEVVAGCEVAWSADGITLSGEVDAGNAAVIGARIRALLGAPVVTVTCTAVTFLDIAGMRMLVHVGASAAVVDTIVQLRCSPAVLRTFQLCGLGSPMGMVLQGDDPVANSGDGNGPENRHDRGGQSS